MTYAEEICRAADGLDEPTLPLALGWHTPGGREAMQEAVDEGTKGKGRPNQRLRKAFVSKGDDATLSRFVKIDASPITPKPRQPRMQGFDNPTIEAGRSLFYRKGIVPPPTERPASPAAYRVLVSGHNNPKIGRDVRKGALAGYWIYTLSLEERATCPRSCRHWGNCYGNGMPYAKRVDHRDPEALQAAIEADIRDILAVRGRAGLLVRLHALGDFFSVEYVQFWRDMLVKYPRLSVFGYTAYPLGDPIGDAVADVRAEYGFGRFAIRHSDGGYDRDCTVSIYDLEPPPGAFVCPEQARGQTAAGKTIVCATCAQCWTTRRNVAFVNH